MYRLIKTCSKNGDTKKKETKTQASARRWREKNRERLNEYRRKWQATYREKNREKINSYFREYYKKNREKQIARAKDWNKRNPKKIQEYINSDSRKAYLKKWKKDNPEKVLLYRDRHREKKLKEAQARHGRRRSS